MHTDVKDADRGLYEKFRVERTDGRSAEGEKHHGCQYFVLDLDHDPHAQAAISAYADSCEAEYGALATDLRKLLTRFPYNRHAPGYRPAMTDRNGDILP